LIHGPGALYCFYIPPKMLWSRSICR
jgi:hypothetical protein